MRTSIFIDFPKFSDKFQEHLNILWSLEQKYREELIPYALEIFKAETNFEAQAVKERATSSDGINIDPAETLACLDILLYIYSQWKPVVDTIDDFLNDLNEIGLVPETKKEEIESFFRFFLHEVFKDNTRRLENIYATSIIPNYVGASTLIDFRGVFERDYGTDFEDRIEDFKSKCIGLAPVIIVRINRDNGDPRFFEFQCKESSLRRLIEELEASIKNLREAESYLEGRKNDS